MRTKEFWKRVEIWTSVKFSVATNISILTAYDCLITETLTVPLKMLLSELLVDRAQQVQSNRKIIPEQSPVLSHVEDTCHQMYRKLKVTPGSSMFLLKKKNGEEKVGEKERSQGWVLFLWTFTAPVGIWAFKLWKVCCVLWSYIISTGRPVMRSFHIKDFKSAIAIQKKFR